MQSVASKCKRCPEHFKGFTRSLSSGRIQIVDRAYRGVAAPGRHFFWGGVDRHDHPLNERQQFCSLDVQPVD